MDLQQLFKSLGTKSAVVPFIFKEFLECREVAVLASSGSKDAAKFTKVLLYRGMSRNIPAVFDDVFRHRHPQREDLHISSVVVTSETTIRMSWSIKLPAILRQRPSIALQRGNCHYSILGTISSVNGFDDMYQFLAVDAWPLRLSSTTIVIVGVHPSYGIEKFSG